MLHYEKGCNVNNSDEINFQDSSKKIVEEYSQLPSTVSIHLSTLLPSLTKIFDDLPMNLDKPAKGPVLAYTFN